jgi:hypothetical protein
MVLLLMSAPVAFAQVVRSSPVGLDHVILGIDDLQHGIAEFTRLTGVTPQLGGEHPGRGTRNALVSLGDGRYLEIVAPILTHPDSTLADLVASKQLMPLGWAVHTGDISSLVARLRASGFAVTNPVAGSRLRPDGKLLSWQVAYVEDSTLPVAPFFIEWAAGTPHPSGTSPTGCRLSDLHLIERRAERLSLLLSTLGVHAHVDAGPVPQMTLTVECLRGPVSFGR